MNYGDYIQKVEYRYQANTPFERLALHDVNRSYSIQGLYGDYWSYWFR